MSLTKIEHVLRAYSALRISGLTSKPTADNRATGLAELEDMMNEFRSRNICSTYIFEDEPEANTDSGISLPNCATIITIKNISINSVICCC